MQRTPIQKASCDLAKEVLQEVNSKALARFEAIERRVFEPHFGVDVGEGLPEYLASGAYLLAALYDILSSQREVIYKAKSPEAAIATLVGGVIDHLAKQRKRVPEGDRIKEVFESLFAKKPSGADAIFSAIHTLPEGPEPLDLLERCTLKVIDFQGRVSTGFTLCPQGHMLTAEHVARGHSILTIAFRYRADNQKQEIEGRAKHVYTNPSKDFAVFQLDEETRKRFQASALTPPALAEEWQPRDWVLCLGYQEQEIFADPISVEAFIKPHDSIRAIRFRDGHKQECLVLVIPRDHPSVVPGMSGGPVLNLNTGLNTGKVIAMVTGATLEAWVKQRWRREEIWELISSGLYSFATPLSDVAESWPALEKCCLQGHKP